MESSYRLLYKSGNTHLQTSLPVYFYGLPDGRIYLIYARFYEINFSKSGLEFVFATLEDYSYDHELGQIISGYKKINLPTFTENIEKKDFQIKIVKSYRNITSFIEAQKKLSKKAGNMMKSCA